MLVDGLLSRLPAEENPIEVRTAFRHGELMLNINTPPSWNGQFQTTRLGMRWYRDAISFAVTKHETPQHSP